MTVTSNAEEMGYIKPPKWLAESVCYETRSGSHAYGVANEDSDIDVVGFCVPPKEYVFPHLNGEILGFGRQKNRFKHFEGHQFEDEESDVWDLTIFNIVEYFAQCMDNNPNWLETLFTPKSCLFTCNTVAEHVRDNAEIFLHKGAFYRFTGFSRSQIAKMSKKDRKDKRLYKYGYHAVRLLDEVEEILSQRSLTLDQNQEKLLAIRQGEWSFEKIESYCKDKEKKMEELYETTEALPHSPDQDKIQTLLLECLEEYYGSLEGCITYGRWS